MALSTLHVSIVFALVLTLTTATSTHCPTITRTTHLASCPAPTPAFCAQPECIVLSILDARNASLPLGTVQLTSSFQIPCGCPTAVPTSTSYTACPKTCQASCGTAYETNIASYTPTIPIISRTQTTISTSTISSSNDCVTITQTTGSACPTFMGCTTENCILLETVTLDCGCPSIYTKTVCATGCQLGCAASYDTLYLPCPTSVVSPVASTTG